MKKIFKLIKKKNQARCQLGPEEREEGHSTGRNLNSGQKNPLPHNDSESKGTGAGASLTLADRPGLAAQDVGAPGGRGDTGRSHTRRRAVWLFR